MFIINSTKKNAQIIISIPTTVYKLIILKCFWWQPYVTCDELRLVKGLQKLQYSNLDNLILPKSSFDWCIQNFVLSNTVFFKYYFCNFGLKRPISGLKIRFKSGRSPKWPFSKSLRPRLIPTSATLTLVRIRTNPREFLAGN